MRFTSALRMGLRITNPESQNTGMETTQPMSKMCIRDRYLDARSERTHMNYSVLATPAEGLSGRFVRMDKKRYGLMPGVTDKDYYTNSFHIPVYLSLIHI